MKCCNAYESESMSDVMGETLRPGGFSLTEQGLQLCRIPKEAAVLDLGCGRGATVNYLYSAHHFRAIGIDPSVKLISEAQKAYPDSDFVVGSGENLPFQAGSFDCVFAECTLSLMDDLEHAIAQVFRVLKENGWFIITDVYAKNPGAIEELNHFAVSSCMRGLHDLKDLSAKLEYAGFRIRLTEDCSDLLKELMVKIGFRYGSMGAFWNAASENCIDGCGFQDALKRCRPGYFMMIAGKGAAEHG